MILIGSHAIKALFEDFPRVPKDMDYVVEDKSLYKSSEKIEYHENPIFIKFWNLSNSSKANLIYTLKVSHLFWDIQWDKHMYDVVFMTKKGCRINRHLFYALFNHWLVIHGELRRSNLKMSAKSFFDNGLDSKLDHDKLHTLINPSPLYLKTIKSNGTVETSMSLWALLSGEEKLELIREECYVMAYERLWNRDYREAYSWQLKELILRHLPFRQALFAIKHYDKLRKPVINYKEKLDYELSRNN